MESQDVDEEHLRFTAELDSRYSTAMKGIHQIHANIDQKFSLLQTLKDEFFSIQEKKFLKSFLNIMDKMSSQLQEVTEAYDSIDKEINSDPHCLYLQKQLAFFQAESLNTKKELDCKKEMLAKEQNQHRLLMGQRKNLENRLKQQTEKDLKYQSKTFGLFEKEGRLRAHFLTHRNSAVLGRQSNDHSLSRRNYSLQLNSQSRRSVSKRITATAEKTSGKSRTLRDNFF